MESKLQQAAGLFCVVFASMFTQFAAAGWSELRSCARLVAKGNYPPASRQIRSFLAPYPKALDALARLRWTDETRLYRAQDAHYLIESHDGVYVEGNPHSVASIEDLYASDLSAAIHWADQLTQPTLNVTPDLSMARSLGRVTVEVRLLDLLEAGGLPYPNVSGSQLNRPTSQKAWIFTIPKGKRIRVRILPSQ